MSAMELLNRKVRAEKTSTAPEASGLAIRDVYKTYPNGVEVLKGVNLEIGDGQFLILVGASGCGKSTLLNMIAGLEPITQGQILIHDRVVNDLPPKSRDIAMVFQSYALYPSMTVRENISFGLEIRKIPSADQRAIVNRVAELLQISHLLDRKPRQLSGGQRQRVAMGRALAREPALFLFDEPLSNLDAQLRLEMRAEIKMMHRRLGKTICYVTHDQIEAMTLGDRIAVMKDGVVQQFGPPQTVYDSPANMFVAGFIGAPPMNFVPGRLTPVGTGLGMEIDTGLARETGRCRRDWRGDRSGSATRAHHRPARHPRRLGKYVPSSGNPSRSGRADGTGYARLDEAQRKARVEPRASFMRAEAWGTTGCCVGRQ
jgi:multiple sugar transport system ATP-binding protein